MHSGILLPSSGGSQGAGVRLGAYANELVLPVHRELLGANELAGVELRVSLIGEKILLGPDFVALPVW